MRTCALIVVLAATFVAGCGDGSSPAVMKPDICSNGAAVEGDSCGAGMICRSSQCVASRCGDGVVAAGEECDDGNTVDGDGCNSNCKFTCLSSDTARNCAPADACGGKGVCTEAHVCAAGTPLADGHACGTGGANVCSAGVCTSPLCGNGVRDFGEECDDGNKTNLDGCDSACNVEQVARITSLRQQFFPSTGDPGLADAFCPQNALGAAIPIINQPVIQLTWDQPVFTGAISLVFEFLGHLDPFAPISTFKLGFLNASPMRFNPQDDGFGNIIFVDGYNGINDLDWWYQFDPASVDATRTPLVQIPGQVTNGALTAGPGTLSNLNIEFAFQPTTITLYHVKVEAELDGVSHPLASTMGAAPGHLASEHMSPSLLEAVSSSNGRMCSDVSARSLAETLMPGLLFANCFKPGDPADPLNPLKLKSVFFVNETDSQDPTNNHLLDAFVSGCNFFTDTPVADPTNPTATPPKAFVPAVLSTQPDGSLDGATYAFIVDDMTHKVNGCTRTTTDADGNNPVTVPDDLDHCLDNATYSSFFKFAADRVIVRQPQPSTP